MSAAVESERAGRRAWRGHVGGDFGLDSNPDIAIRSPEGNLSLPAKRKRTRMVSAPPDAGTGPEIGLYLLAFFFFQL